LADLPSGDEVRTHAERLLREADAFYRFPTPVEDIVAAANLDEPKHSILASVGLDDMPSHLLAAMRRVRGKVEGLLDRSAREVHLSPDVDRDNAHGRFVRLHEVSHEILPWQAELGYADSRATLAPGVKKLFEWEANQGAAELGFQCDVFTDVASEYEIGLAAVQELAEKFGLSRRATLWRYAETHHAPVAAVVLERKPRSLPDLTYKRCEAVCSGAWSARFGATSGWPELLTVTEFDFLSVLGSAAIAGTVGKGPARFGRHGEEPAVVEVETFDNSYNLLVLLWVPQKRFKIIRRRRQAVG
jgi:hypothetical protein